MKSLIEFLTEGEAYANGTTNGPAVEDVQADIVDEDAAANCAGGGAIAGLGVGPQGEPGGRANGINGTTSGKKRKKDLSVVDMLKIENPMSEAQDIEDKLDEDYNKLAGLYVSRLKQLQSELGRVRFGLSRNPNSRKLKKEEGTYLNRITREFNKLGKHSETAASLAPVPTPASQTTTVPVQEATGPTDTFAGADVFDVTTDKFLASRFGKNRYHRYSKYVGEDETGEAIRQHGRSTKKDIILKDGTTGAMIYLRRKRT